MTYSQVFGVVHGKRRLLDVIGFVIGAILAAVGAVVATIFGSFMGFAGVGAVLGPLAPIGLLLAVIGPIIVFIVAIVIGLKRIIEREWSWHVPLVSILVMGAGYLLSAAIVAM